MATHKIAWTRRLRANDQAQVSEEQFTLDAQTFAELREVLLTRLGDREMLAGLTLDGKEIEHFDSYAAGLPNPCAIAARSISVEQFVIDELAASQIHFDALKDLLSDIVLPCKSQNMTEINRLFSYLADLLQWLALLVQNAEQHLGAYLDKRSLRQSFHDHAENLEQGITALLDYKDKGKFPEIGELAELRLGPAVGLFNTFIRSHSWK